MKIIKAKKKHTISNFYTGERISYAQRTVQRERPLFDVQYDTLEFIGLSKRFDCFTTLATKLC